MESLGLIPNISKNPEYILLVTTLTKGYAIMCQNRFKLHSTDVKSDKDTN